MHHNPMRAHVAPPNRLRKLLVKDNSTRNEEAAVISTSCAGVGLFLFLHTGETRAKYLENVGSRIREERFTPRAIGLAVQHNCTTQSP